MNKYNLIEYSDNYEYSTASLYHFKRQEQNYAANGDIENITVNDSSSFIIDNITVNDSSSLVVKIIRQCNCRRWKCSLEKCSNHSSTKIYFILL